MTNAAQHESPVVTALCSQKEQFVLPLERLFFFKNAILSTLLCVVLSFYNEMLSGHIHSVLMYRSKQLLKCVEALGASTAYRGGM